MNDDDFRFAQRDQIVVLAMPLSTTTNVQEYDHGFANWYITILASLPQHQSEINL